MWRKKRRMNSRSSRSLIIHCTTPCVCQLMYHFFLIRLLLVFMYMRWASAYAFVQKKEKKEER